MKIDITDLGMIINSPRSKAESGGGEAPYRAFNAIFSRLMDAGKLLFGRIMSKGKNGSWLRIDIMVFLHE